MFIKIKNKILNHLLKKEFNIKYIDLKHLLESLLESNNIYNQNKIVDGKILNSGERQVSQTLDGIRCDHLGRYKFANNFILDNDNILDLACGIGYGSFIMSQNKNINITSIDISQDAIDYANKYYKNDKINFVCSDCFKADLKNKSFNKIISFETIEHIEEDIKLLNLYHNILKDDGLLILSTPNELLMPFSKNNFQFHIKHYKPNELEILLNKCGFVINGIYSQKTNKDEQLIKGWNGVFNIVVCKKA